MLVGLHSLLVLLLIDPCPTYMPELPQSRLYADWALLSRVKRLRDNWATTHYNWSRYLHYIDSNIVSSTSDASAHDNNTESGDYLIPVRAGLPYKGIHM